MVNESCDDHVRAATQVVNNNNNNNKHNNRKYTSLVTLLVVWDRYSTPVKWIQIFQHVQKIYGVTDLKILMIQHIKQWLRSAFPTNLTRWHTAETRWCKKSIIRKNNKLAYLKAVLELATCLWEISRFQTCHAPSRPDSYSVQLALGGHFHGQAKPIILNQLVPNTSGEIWLRQLLDGWDLVVTRRDEETKNIHSAQVRITQFNSRWGVCFRKPQLGIEKQVLDETAMIIRITISCEHT